MPEIGALVLANESKKCSSERKTLLPYGEGSWDRIKGRDMSQSDKVGKIRILRRDRMRKGKALRGTD